MSGIRRLVGEGDNGRQLVLGFDAAALTVASKSSGKPTFHTSLYSVLWAECSRGHLDLHFLTSKPIALIHLTVKVPDDDLAQEWSEQLMQEAYLDVKPLRNLKVIINLKAGQGKSVMLFRTKVEPILKAARCTINVTQTEHATHAHAIGKELPLVYDAILIVSGDGLAHQLINGFAEHADPKKAFSTPLVPIPTGSANGTSIGLLGEKDGLDVAAATLNAIKGRPMRFDICSVTLKDKRIFSYMSQATGLIADIDLGTEHLRWMGSSRFLYGYVRGIITRKPCPLTLSVKVIERDKHKIWNNYLASRDSKSAGYVTSCEDDWSPLPKLKYSKQDDDGWIDIDIPFIYVYAGKTQYSSRDLMAWPMAIPYDGAVDLLIAKVGPRFAMLRAMFGAGKGASYWSSRYQYIKADAYRVKTHGAGRLSIDGEEYPFEDFQVEVHRGMGSFLSRYGHYCVLNSKSFSENAREPTGPSLQ